MKSSNPMKGKKYLVLPEKKIQKEDSDDKKILQS